MTNISNLKSILARLFVTFALVLPAVLMLPVNTRAESALAPEAPESICSELWDAQINVSDNAGANQNLVFGQGIFATTGNNACDQLAPPPPPIGAFDARFIVSSPANHFLVDYRLADKPSTIRWRIQFQPSMAGGYPFTFTWNSNALPGAGTIRLMDIFNGALGVSIDMRTQNSYVLENEDIDRLEVVYVTSRCLITAIADGNWESPDTWNENCSTTPAITDDVYIPGGVDVTFSPAANTTIESLTVATSASLLLANANALLISDNAFLRGGSLDLGMDGNMMVNGEIQNAGLMVQTKNVGELSAVNFLKITTLNGLEDRYRGLDFSTTAGNNLGATTVRIMGSAESCNNPAFDGGRYRNRCFLADSANAGNATVTLYTTPSEDDVSDDAFFQHLADAIWSQRAACNDPVGAGGSCSALVSFGSPEYFLIGSQVSNPTAVKLASFKASNPAYPVKVIFILLLEAVLVVLSCVMGRRSIPKRVAH